MVELRGHVLVEIILEDGVHPLAEISMDSSLGRGVTLSRMGGVEVELNVPRAA